MRTSQLLPLLVAFAAYVDSSLPSSASCTGSWPPPIPSPRLASIAAPNEKATAEEWRRAQEYLDRALLSSPKDSDVMARYATLLRLRGDRAGAADMLYRALALSPANLAATLELAEVEREENVGFAGQILREATIAHPNSAKAHACYASLLQSVGERDAAIHYYQVSSDLDPTVKDVQIRLAQLLKERGEDDAGDSAMRRALLTSPTDNALLCEHAESLLCAAFEQEQGSAARRRMAEEAQRCLESAVRLIPNDVNALMALASHHQSYSRDMQQASNYLEKAWEFAPNNYQLGLGLGRLYISQGKLGHALDVLNEVVKRCPRNVQSWCALAQAQLSMNDTHALDSFEAALELDPNHAHSLTGYGLALKNLDGDFEGAEAAYKTALRIKPDDVTTLCNMGKLNEDYYHDEDDAIMYYMKALDIDPTNVRAHFWRGRIYEEERMDMEAAVDFYLQTAKWGQHSDQYEERYLCAEALTRVAYIKWRTKNATKTARLLYESALTVLPTHVRALRQEAALFASLGLPQTALCLYSSALRIDPSDAAVRAELADVCQLLNYTEYSLQQYEEVLGMNPNDPLAMKGLARLLKQMNRGQDSQQTRQLNDEAKKLQEAQRQADKQQQEEMESMLREMRSGSSVRMVHQENGKTLFDQDVPFKKPNAAARREAECGSGGCAS